MPQKAAGRITEPPVWVPMASGTMAGGDRRGRARGRAARACARAPPGCAVSAGCMKASSVVTVLPMMTAPAARSRATTVASVRGTPAGVEGRAVLGRDAGGVDDVLDPDRQAVQRPDRPAARARARRRPAPRAAPARGRASAQAPHRRLALARSGRRTPRRARRRLTAPRAIRSRELGRGQVGEARVPRGRQRSASHRPAPAASRRSAGRRRRSPCRR